MASGKTLTFARAISFLFRRMQFQRLPDF